MEHGGPRPTGVVARVLDPVLHLPSSIRRILVTAVFVAELAAATFLAFYIRFEGEVPSPFVSLGVSVFGYVVLVYLVCYLALGAHRGLWSFSGIHDFMRIPAVALAGSAGSYLLVHHVRGVTAYPRSIYVLTASFLFILMAMNRGGVRLARQWHQSRGRAWTPVVIVGAGRAGEMLVRDMKHSAHYAYKPVAFVDRDLSKRGSTIHGIPVAGDYRALAAVIARHQPREIIVAIPSASPAQLRAIVKDCQSYGLPIKVLPSVRDILRGDVAVSSIRPLVLSDLLTRAAIPAEVKGLEALIEGKCVLVTGAGGSIGSELCRQIARNRPARLVLVERYENNLYAIENSLVDLGAKSRLDVRPCLADVLDSARMEAIFSQYRPDLVFHAAAHKHVPIVEANPGEGVLNNVLGTYRVASFAKAFGAERVILVSTDKAVNPANVMGATKRFAEYIVRSMNGSSSTRFITVRFGNVLGSNGSVVPRFQQQIERGGPVTVTHPDIERYFMLIPEAVHLILEAAQRGDGGEVFVLDMGDPVKIVDLAQNMIRLAGYVPHEEISIVYTGPRPGEKLFEELFDKEERVEQTTHPKLRKAVADVVWSEQGLAEALSEVKDALESRDAACLQDVLRRFVPSYQPGPAEEAVAPLTCASEGEPARGRVLGTRVESGVELEVFPSVVAPNGSIEEVRSS
ncbi:MAG: polysaccharide biosynthesis protein [Nitrospirae bacterium]|nr:polysaccharide biosynthesis protein [Nitrospirota bacterium]